MTDHFTSRSLRAALGERPFRFYERTTSTQDIAREWAMADPALASGALVIAEEQTAGRGRQGRAWQSSRGAGLTVSIVLRPHIAPEHLPRVTMVGGIAVAETLSAFLSEGLALKWPNDVLVRGRKISGILSEAVWLGDRLEAVIMGIGLNVRLDFSGTDLADHATSLESEIGRGVDRHVILANLLGHVSLWMDQLHDLALVQAWRGWLGTLGKKVTVYPQLDGSAAYTGIAEAVDDDGALWVHTESGERRRVIAADVGLWEGGE